MSEERELAGMEFAVDGYRRYYAAEFAKRFNLIEGSVCDLIGKIEGDVLVYKKRNYTRMTSFFNAIKSSSRFRKQMIHYFDAQGNVLWGRTPERIYVDEITEIDPVSLINELERVKLENRQLSMTNAHLENTLNKYKANLSVMFKELDKTKEYADPNQTKMNLT